MTSTRLGVVVLAAGIGSRMHSNQPKVLHRLAGRPLLAHVLETAEFLAPDKIAVVYGHEGEKVRQLFSKKPVIWCEQSERLGTGHAVMQAMPELQDMDRILVLYGDVPLIGVATLKKMLNLLDEGPLVLLTNHIGDPRGYGRIIRNDQGEIKGIVEHKDADDNQKDINEINTGMMAMLREPLESWLSSLENDNQQGEYYLTDIVAQAAAAGLPICDTQPAADHEVVGVNNRVELAELERTLQRIQANQLMMSGVTVADPERIDIRGELVTGRDVTIDINLVIEGRVELGDGVIIGPNVLIKNAKIGAGTEIHANSVIEDAQIADQVRVGPFARIRPGAEIETKAHIGNFVEIKKSHIGEGSKVNHLSYIGDCRLGKDVNVGAGTITCNYDGVNKHQTIIGDRAFIGSCSQLVAPVAVGDGATIGAGSTITRNAPADQLTLSRAKQVSLAGWQRPSKATKDL